MDDLVAWLSGCLDVLEEAAHEAIGEHWRVDGHEVMSDCNGHRTVADAYGNAGMVDSDMRHIALNDPRAVLARVEAERAVLALVAPEGWRLQDDAIAPAAGHERAPEDVLQLLAYGHRFDHPGFRDDWALTS